MKNSIVLILSKFVLSIVFCCIFTWGSKAQTANLDSLQNLLSQPVEDSLKGYLLDELSYEWFYNSLDSSLLYGQKAYRFFQQIDDQKGLSRATTSIAVAYHYQNEWDSAKYYYEQSLNIKNRLGDKVGEAGSLNNLGVLYMDLGKLTKATQYFLESLGLKEALNDTLGTASGNANLGLIYRKQGNTVKAIEYYEKALNIYIQFEETGQVSVMYLNLGALHNYSEQFHEGLKYNLKALEISEQLESDRYTGESYVNISDSYLGLGLSDSSLYYTESAIEIFEHITDTLNLAESLLSASYLYFEKENYSQSLDYSLKLEELNKLLGSIEIRSDNALILSKAYSSVGQMSKAYFYLNISYDLRDSLLNESMSKSVNELTIKFETEKKEKKIVELELDKNTNALALASSKNQRNLFISGFAIVLIVAGFLFYLYSTNKKTSDILSKKNTQISEALAEREMLLKEIHHRVKNNLQVISSLLYLQAESLDDEAAIDAVRQGQHRVEAMGLIHQRLYSADDVRGVDIQGYFEQLCDEIITVFGDDDTEIEHQVETNKLMLDIDTVIPLGLIVNELITNAIKYAFDGKEEGLIAISVNQEGEKLVVRVKDNGIGMTEESLKKANSFGWKMMRSLSRKLDAEINIKNDLGTTVELIASRFKLVK